MSALVSLLIPVHNAAPYLDECLASAVRQTHQNLEILCCDDGSEDDSLETLRRIAKSDSRIRVLAQSPNRGVVATRNLLLRESRGEYIAWLDADDFIALEKIARQLAFLNAEPDCGAVGTGVAFIGSDGKTIRTESYPDDPERQGTDPYLCCASAMVRREAAEAAGSFRSLFNRGGEDGDWLLRIADRRQLRNIPDPLYCYRVNPNSVSRSNAAEIRRLGVIARMAARERRASGICPIDSGEFKTASPHEILACSRLAPREKVLALSLHDMTEEPLLTVVVPYYESELFIDECLESLAKQSFQNFEVVLYDDASSKPLRVEDVSGSLGGMNGRVRILRGEENRGPAFARNRILDAAKGRFIVFQDSDDTSDPIRFWALLDGLFERPETVAVGCGVLFTDAAGKPLRSEVYPEDAITLGGFNGCCATFLYDRMRAPHLRFDEDLRHASEDVDFLLRLEDYGKVRNIPSALYRYRVRPSSLTSRSDWLESHLNYMWRRFARRMGVFEDAESLSTRMVDLILTADGTQTGELLLTKAYRDWRKQSIGFWRFSALMRLFPRSAIHILGQHLRLAFENQAKRAAAAIKSPARVAAKIVKAGSRFTKEAAHAASYRYAAVRPKRGKRILVQILDNWGDAEEALFYLLPGRTGRWDCVQFSFRTSLFRKPDYVLVLNQPSKPARLRMSPNRVWFAIGEPPTVCHEPMHLGQGEGTVVYTPGRYPAMNQQAQKTRRYRTCHTMTRTWWVKRTFEELNRIETVEKSRLLSWVTSDIKLLRGHRERMAFLSRAKEQFDFDLFGRGFHPLQDKWHGVAPYHFSIAYENTRAAGYFTEKLMDCFVALTVPFYVGAPDIGDYFPQEALVAIDPNDPDVFRRMKEEMTVANYERRLGALREAKRLVLNRYNMFIYLADAIIKDEEPAEKPRVIELAPVTLDWSKDQ